MMKSFIDPEEVLDQFILRSDMIAAEFGCGSGGFAIPLAQRLDEGLVYGIDILQEPLSALKSRCLVENITNVKPILSNLEKERGSTLHEQTVDLVFIPNVLFQIEDKNAIISEAARILKKQGRLIVIDWLPNAGQGPEEKVSPDEVKELAKKDFKLEKEFKAGKFHYVLIFEKI